MRKKPDRNPLRMLVLISQIGICMLVPVFFCVWLGSVISRATGIELLFPLLLLIGILSGFRTCYIMIQRFISFGEHKNNKKEESDDDDMEKMDRRGE